MLVQGVDEFSAAKLPATHGRCAARSRPPGRVGLRRCATPRWLESGDGVEGYNGSSAGVWDASIWWSVAVVLVVLASVLWLGLNSGRQRKGRSPALGLVPLLVALCGTALTVGYWWSIPVLNIQGGGWVSGESSGGEIGNIVRDELYDVRVRRAEHECGLGSVHRARGDGSSVPRVALGFNVGKT